MLYKDRPEVNQRNDSAYSQVLKEEALFLKNYYDAKENKDVLREVFLPDSELSIPKDKGNKLHYPKHEQCSGIKKGVSTKLTEKRICRCMFYYGKSPVKCQNCFLEKKWQNVGEIKVTNYEWPTKHVYEKTGGIDLILDDKYAVEVKPKGSPEPLTRMIAEIITYTLDSDKEYKPGICFFKDSQQMKDFENYRNNEDLQYILKFIQPFYIRIIEDGSICKFEILPLSEKQSLYEQIPDFKDGEKRLKELTWSCFEQKKSQFEAPSSIKEQLVQELNDIIQFHNEKYFLFYYELLSWCNENDIAFASWGSAETASLTAYILGMTKINPIKFGLIYQSHVKYSCRHYTDSKSHISLNFIFDKERINEILNHIQEKYGIVNLCNSSYSFLYGAKAVINYDFTKLIKLAEQIRENKDCTFSYEKIPLDDKEVINEFAKGNLATVDNDSNLKLKKYLLKEFYPESFSDLILFNTLFGFQGAPNDLFAEVLENKRNGYTIESSEILSSILCETYGIIVYDVQLLEILNRMAGYSYKESEFFLKSVRGGSIGDSNIEKDCINDFIKRTLQKGTVSNKQDAINLIHLIKDHNIFPKDKSFFVVRTIVDYWEMYVKVHFREEYDKVIEKFLTPCEEAEQSYWASF